MSRTNPLYPVYRYSCTFAPPGYATPAVVINEQAFTSRKDFERHIHVWNLHPHYRYVAEQPPLTGRFDVLNKVTHVKPVQKAPL
jgi:hypothetical protein